MTTSLDDQFAALAHQIRQTISLLEEVDDRFWITALQRALRQVEEHRLSGATFVLGCYGGQDTFSDIIIAQKWADTDPLNYRNANARLATLRNAIFESANAIASRRHW